MGIQVLGISGSPVSNSNTDRVIKAILDATGLETEFVKLSQITVRPCFACKQCVPDNICKVQDDFPKLAEKVKTAGAIVIGGYIPYGQIDGFTKAFLERIWSLRHVNNFLRGKLAVTVMTGLMDNLLIPVNQSLATELGEYERMELIGQLSVCGNIPCITCGMGEICEMSAFRMMKGANAKTSDYGYNQAEQQEKVWNEAMRIGEMIGQRIKPE